MGPRQHSKSAPGHTCFRGWGAVATAWAALAVLVLVVAPSRAGAQGQWMDIGSGVTYTITVERERQSFERFAPFAFGPFGPGNYVYAELLPWPCSELPAPTFCGESTFVRGFYAHLDTGTCPCTGVLFVPVEIELHYEPAQVAALGAREHDLRLAMYDVDVADWIELPEQAVHADRDVIAGSQSGHARQYYAILVRPQPASTWGRVKAQWARP